MNRHTNTLQHRLLYKIGHNYYLLITETIKLITKVDFRKMKRYFPLKDINKAWHLHILSTLHPYQCEIKKKLKPSPCHVCDEGKTLLCSREQQLHPPSPSAQALFSMEE
jgi:hypothetical protein